MKKKGQRCSSIADPNQASCRCCATSESSYLPTQLDTVHVFKRVCVHGHHTQGAEHGNTVNHFPVAVAKGSNIVMQSSANGVL